VIALIGGSGLSEIEGFAVRERLKVVTPFGNPSDSYDICEFSGKEFVFLRRHGSGHALPPHKINYRANIWGLKELGVTRILSVGATGAILKEIEPGRIVIPDQLIDMTWGREATFFDTGRVYHIDFTEPYCNELRSALLSAGRTADIDIFNGGTYVCTNGPRLETRAEILFFAGAGSSIVGMTAMPEASLAREAGICYAGINVATNYAAGLSGKSLTVREVVEVMSGAAAELMHLICAVLAIIPSGRSCLCGESLQDAGM
jgi:5'-methylthioadenosine phosphorylase